MLVRSRAILVYVVVGSWGWQRWAVFNFASDAVRSAARDLGALGQVIRWVNVAVSCSSSGHFPLNGSSFVMSVVPACRGDGSCTAKVRCVLESGRHSAEMQQRMRDIP